ncbi:MAG: prephenate dehydrogenase [Firmicutes bacterium]|nr:prephenate dehydrogenase [Bacillota bacterium]
MNIGIIGLGLIGGSLGRAILKKTPFKVFGYDISEDTMMKAGLLGAITAPLVSNADYENLDILLICLNPKATIVAMREASKKLKKGTTVMDIAGTKRGVLAEMKKLSEKYPLLKFIGTHPMAGKEFSGINHSSPLLFEKASVLIAPVSADIATLSEIKSLLTDIGFGFVKTTTGEEHDKIIAYTSQLPHVISSCFMLNPVCELNEGFSAGSFRDLTRVAKLNPEMWAELFLENRDNLINEIEIFVSKMNEVKAHLASGNEIDLTAHLLDCNAKKEQMDKQMRTWKKQNDEAN